jgi:dienelactone hydrolase
LPVPESVTVKGAGGVPVQLWILKPPGFDAAKRYPLVFWVHGGPQGAFLDGWSYRWNPQLWAAQGWVLAMPNPRGSTGFGQKFTDDISRDWGGKVSGDLMAALDWCERQPWVDRNQIVLVGQSAGGFAAIAAASKRPPGVVAVANFAGGRGGRPDSRPGDPCNTENMRSTISRYAQSIRVPVLWHYAENDRYFGPEHVNNWFLAFESAGAPGTLVMQPPFGRDGHNLFVSPAGRSIWALAFDVFMMRTGYSLPVQANKNHNN